MSEQESEEEKILSQDGSTLQIPRQRYPFYHYFLKFSSFFIFVINPIFSQFSAFLFLESCPRKNLLLLHLCGSLIDIFSFTRRCGLWGAAKARCGEEGLAPWRGLAWHGPVLLFALRVSWFEWLLNYLLKKSLEKDWSYWAFECVDVFQVKLRFGIWLSPFFFLNCWYIVNLLLSYFQSILR